MLAQSPTRTKISREMLLTAIAACLKQQSSGLADIDVTAIYGVVSLGLGKTEAFAIDSLELDVQRSAPVKPANPASRARMRLAAVDGTQL